MSKVRFLTVAVMVESYELNSQVADDLIFAAEAARMAGSTPVSHTAGRPSRAGSTSTTTTDPAPPSAATRPSPG